MHSWDILRALCYESPIMVLWNNFKTKILIPLFSLFIQENVKIITIIISLGVQS